MNTTSNKTIEQLEQQAHELAEHGRELAEAAASLERKLRMARGTRDLTSASKIARRPATEYKTREPDEMSTTALYETIKRLVTERPQRFRDIVEITQAGENRIKGVLMRLQRDEVGLMNLGDHAKALWFIPTGAILKRLSARRSRR